MLACLRSDDLEDCNASATCGLRTCKVESSFVATRTPCIRPFERCASLNVLRFGHGLVVLNDKLFAVGGYGDDGGGG